MPAICWDNVDAKKTFFELLEHRLTGPWYKWMRPNDVLFTDNDTIHLTVTTDHAVTCLKCQDLLHTLVTSLERGISVKNLRKTDLPLAVLPEHWKCRPVIRETGHCCLEVYFDDYTLFYIGFIKRNRYEPIADADLSYDYAHIYWLHRIVKIYSTDLSERNIPNKIIRNEMIEICDRDVAQMMTKLSATPQYHDFHLIVDPTDASRRILKAAAWHPCWGLPIRLVSLTRVTVAGGGSGGGGGGGGRG